MTAAIRALLTLALVGASISVMACECAPPGYLDEAVARPQRHAFLFRVLSMEVLPSGTSQLRRAQGRIEVLAVLKGDGRQFHTIRSSFYLCCGIRMQPGMTYFAFTSQTGPGLYAHNGNILELPAGYFYYSKQEAVVSLVAAMLDGKGDLPEELWMYSARSIAVGGGADRQCPEGLRSQQPPALASRKPAPPHPTTCPPSN